MSPTASFNYLSDARDLRRLAASVHLAARVFAADALQGVVDLPGPSSYSGFAKKLGRQTVRNYLVTAPIALAIDALPAARRLLFRRAVAGGMTLEQLLTDEDALEAYVRGRAVGQWHACGTCRMGPAEDRDAVVDPRTGPRARRRRSARGRCVDHADGAPREPQRAGHHDCGEDVGAHPARCVPLEQTVLTQSVPGRERTGTFARYTPGRLARRDDVATGTELGWPVLSDAEELETLVEQPEPQAGRKRSQQEIERGILKQSVAPVSTVNEALEGRAAARQLLR